MGELNLELDYSPDQDIDANFQRNRDTYGRLIAHIYIDVGDPEPLHPLSPSPSLHKSEGYENGFGISCWCYCLIWSRWQVSAVLKAIYNKILISINKRLK